MKLKLSWLIPLAIATASLSPLAAYGQSVRQTPLAEPIQLSGLAGGSQSSSCGFLPASPDQVLQVTEAFASFDIRVEGETDFTLYIEGDGGFSECLTTDRFSQGQLQAPGLLNQGTYRIYVGSPSAAQSPFNLFIQQR
ncbi:hypothetical protein C7271_23235 [filamentous cyanobacterium CCP5]|nr:hypothetical protein C7271_23235 [filamentous cyanobacterium CCP5]